MQITPPYAPSMVLISSHPTSHVLTRRDPAQNQINSDPPQHTASVSIIHWFLLCRYWPTRLSGPSVDARELSSTWSNRPGKVGRSVPTSTVAKPEPVLFSFRLLVQFKWVKFD